MIGFTRTYPNPNPAKKTDEISALRKQLFAAIEKEKNESI